MDIVLVFIFIALFLYLARPGRVIPILRSRFFPHWDKASDRYPVPEGIDKSIFDSRRFKPCMVKDAITSKLTLQCQFKATEEGMLIWELNPWSLMGVRRKILFVPRDALVESTHVKMPWNMEYYFHEGQANITILEMKDTPIFLFVRKKDWSVADGEK